MTSIPRLFISALTCFLLLSAPGQAQSETDKRALAKSYAQHSIEMMDLDKMALMSAQPMLMALQQLNPSMTEEQTQQVTDTIRTSLYQTMKIAMTDIDKILIEIFTYEELKALDAFARSTEGRSALKKMPNYMARIQPIVMTAISQSAPELNKAIQDLGLRVH